MDKLKSLAKQGFFKVITPLLLTLSLGNPLFAKYPTKTEPKTKKITASYNCLPPSANMAAIQPIKSGNWNDTSIWPGGNLPTASDDVTIPQGETITLVGTCLARTIRVNGVLNALTQENGSDINLTTKHMVVIGANARFEIGTAQNPYLGECLITLTGSNTNEMIPGTAVNTKAILVMNNATMNLQGRSLERTWTKLNASASAGEDVITFKDDMRNIWNVGDEIIIASSDFDMNEAEQRTITGFVNANTIRLNQVLQYDHFGELQNYTHKIDTDINWTLDERAEVGLLTHNIKIQGDDSSPDNRFGGHIMVMNDSEAYVESVELFRMGQFGKLGRYPFHWHGLRDAGEGQYFNKNSVHHTYNRAVTIHSTNNVDVIANVAYDNMGHAYFMEDGNEVGCRILNNLGLVTRRPPGADPSGTPQNQDSNNDGFLPSDRMTTTDRNFSGPATFWITKAGTNQISGNIAGGSDGSGIWYAPFNNPNGLYPVDNENFKDRIPDGFLSNNIAHSSRHGIVIGEGPRPGDESETPDPNFGLLPPDGNNATFTDLLMYKNALGLYHRTRPGVKKLSTLRNCIFADNRVGEASTWETIFDRILWVPGSNNYSDDYAHEAVGGSVSAAHIIYDGPVKTKNSHFGGTTRPEQSIFDQWGANIKYSGHSFENTTADPGAVRYNWRDQSNNDRFNPVWFLATARDIDGTLTGVPNSTISKNHPYLTDSSSVIKSVNGAQTDLKFAYAEVEEENRPRPDVTVLRADGGNRQYTDKGAIQYYPLTLVINKPEMRSRFVFKERIPNQIPIRIFSLSTDDDIMFEIPNVPSSMVLKEGDFVDPISTKTIEALTNVTKRGASWFWKDGTVYIKYRGLNDKSFLDSDMHSRILLCVNNDCGNPDGTVPVVLSDYGQRDTRGAIVKNGPNNIGISEITNANGRDQYTVTKQGANDACAEYVLKFGVQNWRDMGRFNIRGTGINGSEIYLHNSVSNEYRRIGMACINNRVSIDIPNNDDFYDNIDEISIKTCESQMNTNTVTIELIEIVMGTIGTTNVTGQGCNAPPVTDCNGTINGDAFRDICGECVGGTTGEIDCTDNTLSLDPVDINNQLKLYPNPVNNTLFIAGNTTNKSIKIYDLLGAEKVNVVVKNNENENEIDLSNLVDGVYIVRVINQDNNSTSDLIYKIVKTY